jgi:tRNA-binding EMAP/Myf-like protein
MAEQSLTDLLAKLHTVLAERPTITMDEKRLIDVVIGDLKKVERTADTRQGLSELAVHFGVDHPTVAAVLRELMALLAQAGV